MSDRRQRPWLPLLVFIVFICGIPFPCLAADTPRDEVRLLFASQQYRRDDIYSMRIDGSDVRPLTNHAANCESHRLRVRERLHLFLQVCDGIQHIHQRDIIHRDIKPSNVLVSVEDGEAIPKIIDFGIAKAVAQPLIERTMYTELGQWIGTPEYMSPEQAGVWIAPPMTEEPSSD